MTAYSALFAAWGAWLVSWGVAALWSAPTVDRAGFKREWPFRLLMLAGAVLLFGPYPEPFFAKSRHLYGDAAWALVALALLGFSFAWWARLSLGPLWSGAVTKKEGHRVVDRGPYAVVRHPIYTGIILAVVATALLKGTILGGIGACLMTASFWIKARLEERFLREELGPEVYDSYRRRVPMLLPFGPKSA